LSKPFFLKILNARKKDLRVTQIKTMAELELYAEETASSVLYLTLEALGVRQAEADHVASHLGKAIGITTLLRGAPVHWKQKHVYLPQDLTLERHITQQKLFNLEVDDKVREVVFEVANTAKHHLDWARGLKSSAPKAALPAFIVSAFVEDYLDRLRKANFNPLEPELLEYAALRPRLKAALYYYTGTY